MHSSEPFDHRSATDPSLLVPAPTNQAWRDEVASRVQSYRARHKRRGAEQPSLALGFEAPPSAAAPQAKGVGQARREAAAAHAAFDTNYYRRLNAQTLDPSARGTSAPAAAARAVAEPEPEIAREAALPEAPEPAAATAPPFDLDLHAPAAGDACLDRYLIQGSAPETDWEASAAEAPLPPKTTDFLSTAPFEAAVAEDTQAEAAPSEALPMQAPAPPQGNLIVFPRPLLEPPLAPLPSRDELAEPVRQRPRILEVPEDIIPAVQGSLFPEIRLDAEEPESPARREPGVEIPLPVAPLAVRLTAGLADMAVVLAGGALFATIAGRAMPQLPHKTFWMVVGAGAMLLLALYQALFLLYAGRTVGMRMNGIRLSTFDGRTPQWSKRRRRACFVLISFASVALGFLWALVDEDSLCWHDRVSQTFPTLE